MKPKDFIFKGKGRCFKEDFKNTKRGTIYLSHTHLSFTFKNGGERNIPLNTIKKLNLFNKYWISIHTDTDESYSCHSPGNTKKFYRILSEVIANTSDGGDVHVGNEPSPNYKGWICWIIFMIASIFASIFWIYFTDLDFSF